MQSQGDYDLIVEDRLSNRKRHSHMRSSQVKSKLEPSSSDATEIHDTNTTSKAMAVRKEMKKELHFRVGNYVGFTREECLGYCYRSHRDAVSGEEGVAVEDKKGLQSSGGYMLLGDTLALFINLLGSGGASSSSAATAGKTPQSMPKAAPKYPNEFLDDGRFFTWFVESSRMRSLLFRKESFPVSANLSTSQPDSATERANQVFLFVRQKRGQYIHCGRCKLIHSEPASTSPAQKSSGMTKLLFELVDYYTTTTTTTHTSTTVDSDPDQNDLQSSRIYSAAISSHVEELRYDDDSYRE